MKNIFKTLAFTLSILLIAGALSATAFAASTTVSPALSVLARDVTVTVTGMSSRDAVFSVEDFDYSLGADVDKITVLTLPDPASGTLCLDGVPVSANQSISRRSISKLSFVPASATADATFYVTCNDSYATACRVRVIDSVDLAPTVGGGKAELYMETMKGGSIRGTVSVFDPEGDALELVVTKSPKKGTVTVTDSAAGEFLYTPYDGKSGADSFKLRARDGYGSWSDEIDVSVRINKNKTGIEYTDMAGSDAYSAAVKMTDAGVMGGAYENGDAYFYPDLEVSREQFVELLMKTIGLSDIPEVSGVMFADDGEMSESCRNYVRAAAKLGFVTGAPDENGVVCFSPKAVVTRAEAAVMLNNIIRVPIDGDAVPVFADSDSIPAWASAAASSMQRLGIMDAPGGEFSPSAHLTRADTAMILSAVIDMVE